MSHNLTLIGADSCIVTDVSGSPVIVYKYHSVTLSDAQFLTMSTDRADLLALFSLGAGEYSYQVAVTAVKTSAYNANANELVPVDAGSAGVTVTLPSAPGIGCKVTVKKIDSSANLVTIACAGSDVFNKSGGVTSGTLTLQNQAITCQYNAGIWYVTSADLSLSALDTRFSASGAPEIPNYASGVWYRLPNNCSIISGGANLAVGQAVTIPFWVPAPKTLSAVALDVINVGDAGCLCRVGFYNHDGAGRPSTLLSDCGTIAGDTANWVKKTGLSVSFNKGWYFATVAFQNFATTSPRLRMVGGSTSSPISGVPPFNFVDSGSADLSSSPNNQFVGYYMSGVTGAFPGIFTVAGLLANYSSVACPAAVWGKFA